MQLYIHVPFCRRRCSYCAFFAVPLATGKENAINAYVASVCNEIALWRSSALLEKHQLKPFSSIFFGGGTPSLLNISAIETILETVSRHFSIEPSAEITFEANPESALTNNWLKGIKATGANRISFGIQSLFDDDLAMLGRVHTVKQAVDAVAVARKAGFSNLSIDLISGVPLKDVDEDPVRHWLRVLEKAVQLSPDHISAYSLTLEEDTALASRFSSQQKGLPLVEQERRMFLEGIAFLEQAGYFQYEISNYAKPGYTCRHNKGYWQGKPYLGVGPSAVSCVGGYRLTNPHSLTDWETSVNNYALTDDKEFLDRESLQKERLMLALRTKAGLDLPLWTLGVAPSVRQELHAFISALEATGLAEKKYEKLVLTHKGMLVSDEIISQFFKYIR